MRFHGIVGQRLTGFGIHLFGELSADVEGSYDSTEAGGCHQTSEHESQAY